jgi:putative Mg2+ transporter-C (MgtC) family protein
MTILPLSPFDIFARIAAALLASFLIGLERESRGRAAGLRTTMLVCMASATAMLLTDLWFNTAALSPLSGGYRPDPTHVAQGLLTGMGFLGAGTILRQGGIVQGLTTSAGLWFVTVLGIAFGSGYYLIGVIAFCLAMFTLFILPFFERNIHIERYATLTVTLSQDGVMPAAIRQQIESTGAEVVRVDLDYNLQQKQRIFQFYLQFRTAHKLEFPQSVIDCLLPQDGVLEVRWIPDN